MNINKYDITSMLADSITEQVIAALDIDAIADGIIEYVQAEVQSEQEQIMYAVQNVEGYIDSAESALYDLRSELDSLQGLIVS